MLVSRMFPAITALAVLIASPAKSDDTDFYKDKTIRLIIGTGIGGSYGLYGQLVSRHLGRFLSGSPSVILQSMPGAGGLVALNHLGTAAPRDGTVITVAHVTIVQEGLFNPKARFDAGQFQWIGRLASLAFVGLASQRSGVRSIADAKMREVTVGAPGLANIPAQAPLVLNKIAGTRFKVISGYNGTGQTFIALERGEVDVAVTSIDGLHALHADKVRRGELVPFFAQARTRLQEFPNVPTLLELGNDPVEKAFLDIFTITADIGRALATPPGVPKERVALLRAAFDKMIADPAFKADAEKLHLSLDPMKGPQLQELVANSMKISPQTRERARAFYDDLFKAQP